MSDTIIALHDQRKKLWEEAKALIDRAAGEFRDLSAEDQQHVDKLIGGTAPDGSRTEGQLERIDVRIAEYVAQENRARQADEARAKYGAAFGASRPESSGGETPTLNDELDASFRSLAMGGLNSVDVVPGKDRKTTRLLTQAKGSTKAEERAFRDSTSESRAAITTAATGAPVPTSFYDQLMWHMVQVGPMPKLSTTIETTSGENKQFPRTSANSTMAIVAEGGTFTNVEPTFSAFITLGAWKYGGLIQLSTELVEDEGVDLLPWISEQAGVGLGVAVNTDFTVGNGTSKPNGIVPKATTGITGGAGIVGVPTSNELIDLLYSVVPPYRALPGCVWMARDTTIAAIRKIKDATSGQYIWQPGGFGAFNEPVADRLLGFPIVSNPDVAATGLNAKSVVFGVVPRYFIRQVRGIRFERSDEFAFGTGLVSFRVSYRADGNLLDTTGAVKIYVGGAS